MQTASVAATGRDDVERVWREQGPKLFGSIVAFTGDTDVANDAIAEAFAQALGRGDAVRHLDRWIWRAAFKIAAGELKRRQRLAPEDGRGSTTTMPESVADLVSALRTLSPNQRTAVILTLYADMPARDAGRVIGCSPATVRVHLAQARRRLRPLLEADDA
jgi:RNA polymerase sigma-70 factor (ECF subfamily)